MKDMPAPSSQREPPVTVFSVARSLAANPLRSFVTHWNWKAGLLSGIFRAALFAVAVIPRDSSALRGVAIQLAFRVAVGGLWGTVAQAFREAEPAWFAGLFVTAVLPGSVHLVEYLFLRASHTSHLRAGMIASVGLSIASLLLNWGLMRKGLLLTGKGSDSLATDLSHLPAALRDFVLAGPRLVVRRLRDSSPPKTGERSPESKTCDFCAEGAPPRG
jgi:hypothetical protein